MGRKQDAHTTQKKREAQEAWNRIQAESEAIKVHLRRMLVEYKPYLIPLKELRELLAKELGPIELSEVVRQMREEETH